MDTITDIYNVLHKKDLSLFRHILSQRRYQIALSISFIAFLTFISFLSSLDNGFTYWDDTLYISNNNLIKDLSWVNIKTLFTVIYARNYNPLVFLTFALEYYFFELEPHVYHITNLSLHILNALLVFWFIFKISNKISISLISALLFGIHPLHVESVAWVAERKDVLSTFFFLQSLIFYLIYKENNRWALYSLSLFVFILSLLSKPMVVTLPVVLLLCDYFFRRKFNRISLIEKIPFFILSIVFGIANIFAQLYVNTEGHAVFQNFFNNILIACWGIIFYLIKTIAPFKLSALYPYPSEINILSPVYFFPPLLLAALTIVIYYSRRWTNVVVFGSLFFIITILPVLQLIHVGSIAAADRYMYIPSIGLFYIAGVAFHKACVWEGGIEKIRKLAVVFFMSMVILFFSVLTYQRNNIWQNSETLWLNVIENYPNAPLAHYILGSMYSNQGHIFKAIKEYQTAIILEPGFEDARYSLDTAYVKIISLDKSIEEYLFVIKLNPEYLEVYNNLGRFYASQGRLDKAIELYKSSLKLKPDAPVVYNNLGNAYFELGRFDSAIEKYMAALRLKPGSSEVYYNLGLTYIRNDQLDEAIENFQTAIRLEPKFSDAHRKLGAVYQKKGLLNKALKEYREVLNLEPDRADVYNKLGVIYTELGSFDKAILAFQKALRLRPDYIDAQQNMERIRNLEGLYR